MEYTIKRRYFLRIVKIIAKTKSTENPAHKFLLNSQTLQLLKRSFNIPDGLFWFLIVYTTSVHSAPPTAIQTPTGYIKQNLYYSGTSGSPGDLSSNNPDNTRVSTYIVLEWEEIRIWSFHWEGMSGIIIIIITVHNYSFSFIRIHKDPHCLFALLCSTIALFHISSAGQLQLCT